MSEVWPLDEEIIIPDVPEPVIGFRCWDYSSNHTALCSLYGIYRVWPYGEPLEAVCTSYSNSDNQYSKWKNDDFDGMIKAFGKDGKFVHPPEAYRHLAPCRECSCGIYAAYDIDIVAGYADVKRAFGLVISWGLVIPGTNGFRAQFSQPACLFAVEPVHTVERGELHRVAEAYDVPLVVPHSLRVEDYREGVRSGVWQNLVKP